MAVLTIDIVKSREVGTEKHKKYIWKTQQYFFFSTIMTLFSKDKPQT